MNDNDTAPHATGRGNCAGPTADDRGPGWTPDSVVVDCDAVAAVASRPGTRRGKAPDGANSLAVCRAILDAGRPLRQAELIVRTGLKQHQVNAAIIYARRARKWISPARGVGYSLTDVGRRALDGLEPTHLRGFGRPKDMMTREDER